MSLVVPEGSSSAILCPHVCVPATARHFGSAAQGVGSVRWVSPVGKVQLLEDEWLAVVIGGVFAKYGGGQLIGTPTPP